MALTDDEFAKLLADTREMTASWPQANREKMTARYKQLRLTGEERLASLKIAFNECHPEGTQKHHDRGES